MKMIKFFEASLDFFTKGATSNLTQKWLDDRYVNESEINFNSATFNKINDYLELVFFAKSSYGGTSFVAAQSVPQAPNGSYCLVLRLYKVRNQLKDAKNMDFQTLENTLKDIIHNNDIKFYSDDPSFFYQGCWEDLAKAKASIFKFTGPNGTGHWHDRHAASGGLRDYNIHLTKHLTQVIREIDQYIPEIAQNLKIK